MSLVTGMLLIIVVVTVVLYKVHRRTQIISTESVTKKQICTCSSYLTSKTHEDDNNVLNIAKRQMNDNTSSYDTIEMSSVELDLKTEISESSCTPGRQHKKSSCQSKRYFKEDVDPNDYLCPILVHMSNETATKDISDDDYLTVL